MNLNLDIYLSGRVQKLYKVKLSAMVKESDVVLHSEWWSVWRCEHLTSDENDRHVFVFTNAASYFTILVYQEGLSLDGMLLQFHKELLFKLNELGATKHLKIKACTRIIKGNPRSLVTIMNNIIYHTEWRLFEAGQSYDQAEKEVNEMLWDGPDYVKPIDELKRLISESPFKCEDNVISFPTHYDN